MVDGLAGKRSLTTFNIVHDLTDEKLLFGRSGHTPRDAVQEEALSGSKANQDGLPVFPTATRPVQIQAFSWPSL
jgi:hypothetical protein